MTAFDLLFPCSTVEAEVEAVSSLRKVTPGGASSSRRSMFAHQQKVKAQHTSCR
jgi:hypothetical protein